MLSRICVRASLPQSIPWGAIRPSTKSRIPRYAVRLHIVFSMAQGMYQNQRFATLVSLMLSSQTKDEVTDAAVSKLRDAIGGSLSVEALIATDDDKISDAICKVGFWRRKTGYTVSYYISAARN